MITRLIPQASLVPMSVFDVGGNQPYIDYGKMEYSIQNFELPSLDTTKELHVSGFILDMMNLHNPEVYKELQKSVEKTDIVVKALPYYGTSTHCMDDEEKTYQFSKSVDSIKKHLGVVASIADDNYIAKSELESHLIHELKLIYPHIKETQDEELLKDWRLLSQTLVLERASPNGPGYENFVTIMNMCNDLVHRIRTFKSAQRGVFLTEPKIVNTPSTLLLG